MNKRIVQFAFKRVAKMEGIPVIDCRIMPNPFRPGVPDHVLMNKVRSLPEFETLVAHGVSLLKEHDEIAIGCLYGKHRSGAVAHEVAKRTGAIITTL